ncbi:MAG: hypothetical protein ACJZ13_00185 [Methylophilaceae bacterium]
MKKLSDHHVKKHIASMAAEIIIEEGVSDYLYAKKKAAKYLNYNSYQILPSNNEIDEAIRDYQATFPSNNVADFIFYQDIAIKIMSELEPFNPLITGTLQEGRVTNNQKILINLFTDNFKEIEYFLLSNNHQFKTKDPRRLDNFLIKYILFYENIETELTVFDILEPRHKDKNKSMIKGRGIKVDEFIKVESTSIVP